MTRIDRTQLIEQIENERNSKVICYITSDRAGLGAKIASDVVRLIYDHLIDLPSNTENIDLFIYSAGGDGAVPWKIIPMLREFCNNLCVLIPFRAYSAATLIALGADKIIMGKKAELGPVDPSISSVFHPENEFRKNTPLAIGVEDVTAFVNFVKEKVQITDQTALGSAINLLIEKVGPLALGNLTRFYFHNRMLIEKLLKTHQQKVSQDTIKHITDFLTEKAYFHGHSINRQEAKSDFKLDVDFPDENIETLMWSLYLEYEKELDLLNPFNPEQVLIQQDTEQYQVNDLKLAFIESIFRTDVCKADYLISRKRKMPANLNLTLNVQIPPGVDPANIPQQAIQALKVQLQQAVIDQMIKQSAVEGIELKNTKSGWEREN